MLERAKQGFHNGSVPFGYRIDHNAESKMVVVEDQAKIVEWIFLSYVNGAGLAKIAKTLNNASVKGAVGGDWCTKSISMVLRNPKYVGMIKLGNNIFQGFHKPIITKDVWESTQSLLEYQSKRFTYRGNNHESRYLLSLCKCTECGRAVIVRNSGNHKYYVCSNNRSGVSVNKCNNSMTYRVEVLEEYIENSLGSIFDGENFDFDIVKKPNEKQFVDDRVKTINTRLNRLKEGYLNGIFNIEEFKKMKESLDDELKMLESQTEPVDKGRIIKTYRTLYEQFKDCNNPGEKRAILKKFLDVIYIGKDSIRIYLYAN